MKTFQQFKEDMTSVQDTMKGFANTMMPQMKKFAKSDEVKNMKKDVLNLFLNKGQDLLNQGQKKIKIPTSDEMSSKVGELSTKLQTKLNDPSFQKKFEKGINFLNTFGNQVPKK